MALQFRRGLESELPPPSDAAVGEPLFTVDTGKLFIKNTAGTLEEISGSGDGSGPGDPVSWGGITGTLASQTDLQGALDLKTDLTDFPQNNDGTLNIAQESTLQSFASTLSTVQSGVAALQYLSTYFTDAALPATPTTTGFLKYDAAASPPAWSLVTSTATAPTEINGGNASSFGE